MQGDTGVGHAFQLTEKNRKDNTYWPQWMHQAWSLDHSEEGSLFPRDYPNSRGDDPLLLRADPHVLLPVEFGWFIVKPPTGPLMVLRERDFSELPFEVRVLAGETVGTAEVAEEYREPPHVNGVSDTAPEFSGTHALNLILNGVPCRRTDWPDTIFVFAQTPSTVPASVVPNMTSLPEQVKALVSGELRYSNQLARVRVFPGFTEIKGYAPTAEDLAATWRLA